MASALWVLVTVLVAQIIGSFQQLESDEVIKLADAKVGCVTAAQAKSISEEIAKLFATAPLVESSTSLFASISTLPRIESCADTHPGSLDFANKFGAKVQQVLVKAAQAEGKINEGNKMKEQQDSLSEKLLSMWKIVQRTTQQHQKILNSLDIFAKDSVLQRAAQIELELKNETIESADWTVESVKDELTKELSQVKAVLGILGPKITDTMDYVVNEIIEYFTTSQMYTSLRSTRLYDALCKSGLVSFRYGYSEVAMSKSIRHVVNMRYGTMITGRDEAEDYVNKVNDTLKEIEEDVESLNTISVNMPCSERYQIGNEALKSLQNIHDNLQNNELITAAQYLTAIEKHGSDYMMPLLTERALASGLVGLVRTLPETGKRTEEQLKAFLEVGGYAVNVRILENVPEASRFVERAFPFFDTITHSTRCYTKTFVAIGKIVQGCADGEGSFDDIYYKVTGNLKMNRFKCHRVTGLRFPFKIDVEGIVKRAAAELGFNSDCTQNKQQDQNTTRFAFYDESDDDVVKENLSPTQRFMVCDLRKKSKPQSQIATLIKIDESSVEAVRCKAQ